MSKSVTDSELAPPREHKRLGLAHLRFAFKRAVKEFSNDNCTDLAAALTYYTVLSLFPALIALISLLGLVGQGQKSVDEMLNLASQVVPDSALDTLRGPLESLVASSAAGWGLVVGLGLALWGASGYVGAFGRALNKVYETEEGRPFWQLRPSQLLVTLSLVVLVVIAMIGLLVSGPVARYVGELVGLGEAALDLWGVLKWPMIGVVVMLAITLLYWATPNIKSLRFKWLGAGASFAFISWVIASLGFGFYVGQFGNYDKTYGTLAGVVIFLLWIWITNLALLLGAELNSEILRTRQLLDGKPSEEKIGLKPRSTKTIDKKKLKSEMLLKQAQFLRSQGSLLKDPKKLISLPMIKSLRKRNNEA